MALGRYRRGGDRSSGAAVALGRAGYRAAFVLLRLWWFVRRPDTAGVKLLLLRDDEVLFVLHSYGRRGLWEVPGGGQARGERPEDTARREASEELGVSIDRWTEVGVFVARSSATATLTCLCADYDGQPIRPRMREIVEVRWAPVHSPPHPLGEHAREALALLAAGRPPAAVR